MKDLLSHYPPTTPNQELVAPIVVIADPRDGLLQVADLNKPVTVTFAIWAGAQVNDRYQLTWNHRPVGEAARLSTPPLPGDVVSLEIPLMSVHEGHYQLGYQITSFVGGVSARSTTTPIMIDRSPPGGALLAAPILPQVALEGLTESGLSQMGDELSAIVPVYFDMKWGDTLHSFWGEQPGPVHVVQPDEIATDTLGFVVDRAFLEQWGSADVAVSYSVRDRAGNTSVRSRPSLLKLRLQNTPAHLLAPIALQIRDHRVLDSDARLGVKIAIPAYDHIAVGDEVTVYWGKERVPFSRRIAAALIGKPLPIKAAANYNLISRQGDGPVTLTYRITRNGKHFTSPGLALEVFLQLPGPQDPTPKTLVNEALAAPLIKGKGARTHGLDNYIDEDDAQRSAEAIIAWHRAFRPGDRINLFWGKQPLPLMRAITRQDVENARALVINVPNALILQQGCGVDVPVSYTVTCEGNPNTSRSPTQPVSVILQMQLPGGTAGLGEPVFTGANVLNALDPRKDPEGTVVYIVPYLNMQVGDRILLHFCGFDALTGGAEVQAATYRAEREVTADEQRNGCRFRVPLARLMAIEHGRGRVRYEVIGSLGRVSSLPADVYVTSSSKVLVR